MTSRERFRAIIRFEPFDRLPVIEWAGWWGKTIDRWHEEGLPTALTDGDDIRRYFGLDIYKQDWIGTLAGPLHQFDDGAYVRTMADYEKIRDQLFPERLAFDRWDEWASEQERGDIVTWFTLEGFFWFPRVLLGIEPHLYAFYEQPELIHRINRDLAAWMVRVIDRLCPRYHPDFMTFAEDMSGNTGPMIGRELFDEFMLPYYRRVVPRLREHGVIPIVDTDGDVTIPAPWFAVAGIEGILPLERQAHVDVARLRVENPAMKFIGHFDKMAMPRGEEAMRAEFERLLPTARLGGFLVSCDHQTPPGVSIENYRTYVRLFREYADLAGAN